ncbi:hypothetical protein Glove_505g9 [Diversispora epigaea]|uniref:Uncharacterized protein n=1 Tax=Diversispora epigaea TaxID=1348612 RepID=A0A397GPZ2_9GLOM|nr:hypothetical protein Glove_505g9 [Diversispora epigaea]
MALPHPHVISWEFDKRLILNNHWSMKNLGKKKEDRNYGQNFAPWFISFFLFFKITYKNDSIIIKNKTSTI